MDDLKRCAELGELLLQPGKEVEDDTSLDRILSEASKLIHSGFTNNESMPSFIEELLAALSKTIGELGTRHTIFAHGYLLQLLSHVISALLECSNFLSDTVTLVLSYPDMHMQGRLREEYYSLASSWISAIKNISPSWECIADLPETGQAYQHLIAMAHSQSFFVRRQAVESIAMILIKLHQVQKGVGVVYKNFTSKSNGSPSSLLDLSRALLSFSYSDGIQILASQKLSVSLSLNRHKLSELCIQCDPVLCHFFESLYCDQIDMSFKDSYSEIVAPSQTLWCAMICISHHPTKAVGWKILMSLLNYGEISDEKDVAMSLVISSLKNWEYSTIIETSSLKYVLNCCDVLISRKNNMPAMGRIFCHILNGTGSSTHNLPLQLKGALSYIVQTISSSSTGNPEVIVRLFMENNNAMIALLGCLSRTSVHFSTGEKEDVQKFLLTLMAKSSTHHAVIDGCHEVVKLLLQHSYSKDFLVECVSVTKGYFADRRWEMRDTAVQFFSDLLSVFDAASRTYLLNLCNEYAVYTECIKLSDDSNAFVRAAAQRLMGQIVASRHGCDTDAILEAILKTMNDTDIFPRRQAVTTLVHYMKNNDEFLTLLHKAETDDSTLATRSSDILNATQIAIHKALFEDLDWEVKRNSLGILELLLQEDLRHHTTPSPNLVSMLHKMENDYEDVVKERAREIAASFSITNHSLDELQPESELQSLLAEALTSLRNTTNRDPAFSQQENSVILDCY